MTRPASPGSGPELLSREPAGAPGAVDRYFSLTARGSTWQREVFTGTSTFLALSYAGATVAGSAAGSSSFVAFVESAVGIRAGARTGLAAVVTGLLLFPCLFLAPVLAHVPVEATTGALVFVAVKMLTARRPEAAGRLGLAVTVTAPAVTVVTLAIDQAMAAAFVVCALAGAAGRRTPRPALWVTTSLLVAAVVLQYLNR
ncbi:SulP family inorganic anion transporter [Streptomyces sp. NPDC058611]|uniref:SulP family inorganic anion transporter n=1 Tax=unclassified Streptomyces TaxID=2593676 RepID=UPI00365B231B